MQVLSIDIGGSHIKTALVADGCLSEKRQVATPATVDSHELILTLNKLIEDYRRHTDIGGIGFAVPGAVAASGLVSFGGAVKGLDQLNLKTIFGEISQLPVAVENDAKAAVLGEVRQGNLQGLANGAAVILGTGVGVGLWLDGRLRQGPHRQAGEASFFVQDRTLQGAASFAGLRLSAVALVKNLSAAFGIAADGAKVFATLEQQPNAAAQQLLQDYCRGVATLCFDLQCLLDLEKIVIGGGISCQPLLLTGIEAAYQEIFTFSSMLKETFPQIPIQAAKFQADANLIGAAEGIKEE